MKELKALFGDIVYAPTKDEFKSIKDGYVVYDGENILGVYDKLPEEYKNAEIKDYKGKVIMPGLCDLHVHAPQFVFRGLCVDKQLLEWLENYAFPTESKFKDESYARLIYKRVAENIAKEGTTRVVLFATIHNKATEILMEELDRVGITAYVGKVNMDRNSPDFLIETSEDSLRDTEKFILDTKDRYKYVKPIITPRFTPSVTDGLMDKLGELARKYGVPVQSHLSENLSEIEWVHELEPDCKYYLDAYKDHDMFGRGIKTVMAHCVHLSDEEIDEIKKCDVFVAHCPDCNCNVASGIAPIRKMLDKGVDVGLGSDIAGGFELSIFMAMREAIKVSKLNWLYGDKKDQFLNVKEAFYMGTTGGAKFFGHKGGFGVGDPLHALVIDDEPIRIDPTAEDTIDERMERLINLCDSRNIVATYANGKEINK